MYFYVYVLLSEIDDQFYTGYTASLKERLEFHNKGLVQSTMYRRPLKFIGHNTLVKTMHFSARL